ncbi:MAG TPA: 2Fe-2S iron-sulfur cluster-binding protein [Ignavibacteria bacterium]|nr:2Fe-2S iron-sulfur cluster-binding protein [Ignavibacteria bacterium]HMQ99023.1 2Fe-2S iron-sulfur cluster-binding protein [Ignavibacteria bacterium]
MPKFFLDGKELDFTPGQTIIEAAKAAGIEIPHFCWHPSLSVAGNCRVCLVEVEKAPKGMIACATQVMEGMVVHSDSPKAVGMRNAVMEFLLINHPLDCPICDEAGECKLQDYAYKYSIGKSRFDEEKNHKDKRVELGPHVMFDQERCISCSRCIRYCEEVVGDPQLTFVNRGEKVTIETFPGKQLDNPYSMNVIELCPVGALTSRDFRFRARVWDMSHTDSICTGCSRGCNMEIWVRDNIIKRLTPRENMDVNQYWMCDYGRLNTYKFVNDETTRVNSPMMREEDVSQDAGGLKDCDWDDAIARVISEVKNYKADEIAFIASAYSTLEDNFVLQRFAKEIVGTDNIVYIPHIEGEDDKLLLRADKTPNANGLKLLGIEPINGKFIDKILNKQFKMVYILNDSLGRLERTEEIAKSIEIAVLHISNFYEQSHKATVVLPSATYAEINGTFVNFQNRLQRIKPAAATLEQERLPGDFAVSRLDKFGSHNDRWTKGTRFNARPAWKVISQMAKVLGTEFGYDNTEEVFDDMAAKIPALAGMSYEVIGSHGAVIGQSEEVAV